MPLWADCERKMLFKKKKQSREKQVSYCAFILRNNDPDKILPITKKTSHGIDFDVWADAMEECGFVPKLSWYNHTTISHEGVTYTRAMQLDAEELPDLDI